MVWLIFAIGGSDKHELALEETPKCSPLPQSYLHTEKKELSPSQKKTPKKPNTFTLPLVLAKFAREVIFSWKILKQMLIKITG